MIYLWMWKIILKTYWFLMRQSSSSTSALLCPSFSTDYVFWEDHNRHFPIFIHLWKSQLNIQPSRETWRNCRLLRYTDTWYQLDLNSWSNTLYVREERRSNIACCVCVGLNCSTVTPGAIHFVFVCMHSCLCLWHNPTSHKTRCQHPISGLF